MSDWNPSTYQRFASERFLPFEDLVALVRVRPNLRVIDLGCGTGELTERLWRHLGDADVVGIDASADMLERARAFARPGLRFERRDIEDVAGDYDLIFSNAALHWVPGHRALFARLYAMLRADGQLVVQMPAHRRPAAYAAIADIARREPHRALLRGFEQHWPLLSIEEYAELLHALGAQATTAFEKVYLHELADADALAEWQSGTALIPYRERLGPAAFAAFEADLRAELRVRYPERPVAFAFRRAILAATRPG